MLSPAGSTIALVPPHQGLSRRRPGHPPGMASRHLPPSAASGHRARPHCRWTRCQPTRQVCHRDTVLSPADSTIAHVPRHQEPIGSTPQASRHEWLRATCYADRQWIPCSLPLPVGTVPTLIADGRDANSADKCVTVTQSSLQLGRLHTQSEQRKMACKMYKLTRIHSRHRENQRDWCSMLRQVLPLRHRMAIWHRTASRI